MGAGAGKPHDERLKLVYQNPRDEASFISNETDTVLLFQRATVPLKKNCIFTKDSILLSAGLELTLTINGPGIVRFGLTTDDPDICHDFTESIITEHEDGLEEGENVRKLSVDAFNFVTYTNDEAKSEKYLAEITEDTKSWLYVIVVQGCPKISIKKDKRLLPLKNFQGSNIDIQSDEAVPRKTSSSGLCRLEEPISLDHTYCINWQMKLEQNDGAGHCSSRKYGFFRFGFVVDLPETMDHLSLYSDADKKETQDTWFVGSAVSTRHYSEMIMFTINKTAEKITHNLSTEPVNDIVTEKFPLDSRKQFYLILEVFHGDICGIQKYRPDKVPQIEFPGHILLFENFQADSSTPEHIQIGAKFKTQPCRIQYGTDPTLVLAEFNKKFQAQNLQKLQENQTLPWDSVMEIKETSKIQVLDVLDGTTADNLEAFFSNRHSSGGGKIRKTQKSEYIPGCWILQYKHRNDARGVWQEGTHRINESLVTVLPYYEELGPAANYGSKPEFDRSDLEILIEDKKRMKFVSTIGREKFEHHMNKLKLRVIWPSNQEPEFEEDVVLNTEDDRERRIVLRCEIPLNQYKQLISWKQNGRKAVDEFLSEINVYKIDVDINVWEDAVSLLHVENKKNGFLFKVNKTKRNIQIVTSSQSLIVDLKDKIQSLEVPEDQTVDHLAVDVLKYRTLDNAGLLTELEKSNGKTSTTLDSKNHKIIFKGPKSEVQRMKIGIQNLLVNTDKIIVKLSKETIKVLKSETGQNLLRQELQKRKLTKNFDLKDSVCEICLYLSTDNTFRKAEKDLQESIKSIISEKTYTIPDSLVKAFEKDKELKSVFEEIEKLNAYAVVISLDGKEIRCTGIDSAIGCAMEQIKQHLQGNRLDKSMLYFQRNIINYIALYKQSLDIHNCTFCKTKDGMLTGEVCFEGNPEEIEQRKKALLRKAEKISTFWFHLKRPWLANMIEDLDILDTLAEDKKCMLQPEIGDTLAEAGVSVVALSDNGTIFQVINCDIITQDTDVIVNAANNELKMTGGLAQAISAAAGPSVQQECVQYIELNGKLSDGETVFTGAGKLYCHEILHVVGPVWKGGGHNEKEVLQKAVKNLLNMVNKKKYLSVMIPAISCGNFGYPTDTATKHIVEAVGQFVSQNPESTVKEICFCDNRQDLVTHFKAAIQEVLLKPWFIFEHNRPMRQTHPLFKHAGVPSVYSRPKSARPGQRGEDLGISLRWGRSNKERNPSPARLSSSSLSSDEELNSGDALHHQLNTSDNQDCLPMTVILTNKTKLTVIKGRIQDQKHDVIVCTTPQFPNLVGAVAYALIERGGESILAGCKGKGNLQYGDVICTGAGLLSCKELFHVRTLMDWDDNAGPKNVQQIVTPCLAKADRKGYASLAFPAIGTGASHYPADQVAKLMTETIRNYVKNNSTTTVKEIKIVVYENDAITAQTFENVLPKLLGQNDLSVRAPSKTNPQKKKKQIHKGAALDEQNLSAAVKVKKLPTKYSPPHKVEQHSVANDVVLVQVTTAVSDMKDIKQKAEKLLDNEFTTTQIDYKELTHEHVLTSDEVQRLHQLNTRRVKIDIDQKRTKVIISGLRADVMKADNDACNLLKTEFPQRRKQKNIESRFCEFVQWQVSDGVFIDTALKMVRKRIENVAEIRAYIKARCKQACQNVSPEVNFELEMKYDSGVDFKYLNNGVEYQVLIQSLEEHPTHNPLMKRKLYRRIRGGQGITVPDIWSISSTDEDYKEVEVQANDPIFTEVKKKFVDAGCQPTTIDKIIRIENRTLYLQYEVMKKKMQIRNPKGVRNEKELWHGTDSGTIKLISQKGFNRSFAGKNATMYGEGVYFANSSHYSHRYAQADGNSQHRMILARVLTGEYELGKHGMTAPPIKTDRVLYDSLVDNVNNPSIFVIFHDTQAYPQYVICYT